MITTTHSHKHWTNEGGHVTAATTLSLYKNATIKDRLHRIKPQEANQSLGES